MAKDKKGADKPPHKIDTSPASADTLKVTIDVDGIKEVVASCEPGDLEKYWKRPTPASFLCTEGATYTFSVPAQVGFASFKQWEHPRTKEVVGTSSRLMLTPTKRNERYVAVYDKVVPVDIVFRATTPKEEVVVTASAPDINGRTQVTTPGRLTYLQGTNVTFSVPPTYVTTFPDVLYKKVEQVHSFLRWEEEAVTRGNDPQIPIAINKPTTLRVLYGASPLAQTPNDREVKLLTRQLYRAIDQLFPSQGVVILVDGKLLPLFGRIIFPNQKNALAALQTAVMQSTPNWLSQAPEAWREWLKVDTQQAKLLDHWLKHSVRIVPVDQLNVLVNEEPKS